MGLLRVSFSSALLMAELTFCQSTAPTPAREYIYLNGRLVVVEVPAAPISLAITPEQITLGPAASRQFTANISGTTDTTVLWSLNPGTGAGTISNAGVYTAPTIISNPQSVTVTATSNADPTKTASATIYLIPDATAPNIITASQLPNGTVEQFYFQPLAAAGGTPPYSWAFVNGTLPVAMGVETGEFANVTGTPSQAGQYGLTVVVNDSKNRSATKTFTLAVDAAAPMPLSFRTSPPLPDAIVGSPYSLNFAAAGGAPPYNWSLTGGTLPPGLTLRTTTVQGLQYGTVAGKLSRGGAYTFDLTVSDTNHASQRSTFTVSVRAVPGDFDGNGVPDLLWQNDDTRQVGIWFLSGAQQADVLGIDYPAPGTYQGWTLVTTADMDGDGVPDLIWQNDATRSVGTWYMGGDKGMTMLGTAFQAPGSYPGWTLVGVADVNGDGVPDLIWQNDTTRQVGTWYMAGPKATTVLGVGFQAPGTYPNWRVVGIADIDGNGVPDLVWQNDITREVGTWYMGGLQGTDVLQVAYQAPGSYPGWKVIAVVDMDGNGTPDLVWQNDTTREVGTWYMAGAQGTTRLGTAFQATGSFPGWRAVGPR